MSCCFWISLMRSPMLFSPVNSVLCVVVAWQVDPIPDYAAPRSSPLSVRFSAPLPLPMRQTPFLLDDEALTGNRVGGHGRDARSLRTTAAAAPALALVAVPRK